MSKSRSRLLFLLAAAIAIVSGGVYAAGLFAPVSRTPRPTEVLVPNGASVTRVGRILERKKLIRSATAFRLASRAGGRLQVKAGLYTLSPSMSTTEILQQLREGAPEQLVRLTFPEGFTLEQVAERASRLADVQADEFQRVATMRGSGFAASFRLPDNLEGYLFPDTYDFRPAATEQDVIRTMVETFDRKVANELAGEIEASARRGYDLKKIVILASLIEREARVKSEQARVSSVLQNRLRIGMPLQVDATVQYVIGHRERLLYRDLEVDSPYNTYKVAGLPPGPICNPGLDAIKAAMNPEQTEYLYYTARSDGSHTFTKTHEEHIRATAEARAGR